MKKLNKKGTSLTELIVSVALLSVVLIFMFRMLTDLNNEITNDVFATDNQVIRAEIIKEIESDLKDKKLYSINSAGSTTDTLNIIFHYNDETQASIAANKDTVTFTNSNNETRKWTLKNCHLYVNKALVTNVVDDNIYAMSIGIEIHTNNDLNTVGHNSIIDDIIISYIGNMNDVDTISDGHPSKITCLGHGC